MRYTKLLLTALTAAIVLSAAVGSASAQILSINEKDIKVEWTNLTFVAPAGPNVVCNLTLEGRLHSRTIRKVERALIGAITRGIVGTCTANRASIYQETLPWHLTYEGFVGTLPRISAVRLLLQRGRFRIENGSTCNARFGPEAGGNLSGIASLDTVTGQVLGLRADETKGITLEGPFPCEFGVGRFAGTGRVSTLPTLNLVFIRLI